MKDVFLCPVTVSEPLGDFYVLTVHSRELCHLAKLLRAYEGSPLSGLRFLPENPFFLRSHRTGYLR